VVSRCICIRVLLKGFHETASPRREAERRKAHPTNVRAAPTGRCRPPARRARCPRPTFPRVRGTAGRGLAFRRPTAALAEATERFSSAQAALHANGRVQALPAPSIALKRSTPRPGRSAGGDDARAARERVTTPARRNRARSIVRLSPATSLR
jgi:hypothetical protein